MRGGGEGEQYLVLRGFGAFGVGQAVKVVGRGDGFPGERGQGGPLVVGEAQARDVVVEDAPGDALALAFEDALAHGFAVVHDHAVGTEQHHADDGGEGHGDEQFHQREPVVIAE